MKKCEKLMEMEVLWSSRTRDTGGLGGLTTWSDIGWEPFTVKGDKFDLSNPKLAKEIQTRGYHFWIWGNNEEASGTLVWDWALLHYLARWYSLPTETVLFVNEFKRFGCVASLEYAAPFVADLFDTSVSWNLGFQAIADRERRNSIHHLSDRQITIREVAERNRERDRQFSDWAESEIELSKMNRGERSRYFLEWLMEHHSQLTRRHVTDELLTWTIQMKREGFLRKHFACSAIDLLNGTCSRITVNCHRD